MPLIAPALSKASATPDNDTSLDTYVLRAADLDAGSKFSVAGLAAPLEKTLEVSHETVAKTGRIRTRLRLARTEQDALLVPQTITTTLVIDRAPSTAITNAIAIEEINKLVDFLIEGGSNANVTALLNQEVQ
jgi:hypothetical protein